MAAPLAQTSRATYSQRAWVALGLSSLLSSIVLSGYARAQDTGSDVVPLGLPPAAEILNTPIGGLPAAPAGGANDLRYQPAAPAPTGPNAPAFSITPSITGEEIFNSNVFESSTKPKADFITAITPGIQIFGSTSKLTLGLQYAPTGLIYARDSSLDTIAQQGVLSATAILVPDTFFVSAHAIAEVAPTGGGLGGIGLSPFSSTLSPINGGVGGAAGAAELGRHNTSQELGATVTPYVEHRFGDVGTAKAGITATEIYIRNGDQINPIPGTVTPGTEREQTGEATAQFLSGEDFGRVRYFGLLDASHSTGTGVVNGAHSYLATNWVGFAVNRFLTPFGEIGYQDLHFATQNGFNVQDAVWQLGVVVNPNPDSQISIGYGHKDGFNSPEVVGYYQVTARTRISVNYTAGLSSDIGLIQSTLALTNFNSFDNPVDAATGAPLFLGTGLLSEQSALFRTHTLVLTASTLQDRNTITGSIVRASQTPVGAAPGQPNGIGETETSFQTTWTHLVSEVTSVGAALSYTRSSFQSSPSGQENFIGATVGVSYRLSPTVSTVARYSFFDRISGFASRGFTENILLIGISKQF